MFICKQLEWPLRLIGITPPGLLLDPAAAERCATALRAGLPALMLREPATTDDATIAETARRIARQARECGTLLIVNRRPELARAIGADAVHLGATGPTAEEVRATLGPGVLLGYSAHAPAEARDAFERGIAYVTASPVFAAEKPWGTPQSIGLDGLRAFCRGVPGRPVVALGGIDVDNAAAAIAAGAVGVAAIRSVFDGDPAVNVRRLLRAIGNASEV